MWHRRLRRRYLIDARPADLPRSLCWWVLGDACHTVTYHIDHLEHSYLQMIMKKLFYTGLLSCQSLADSLAFIQIVAFVKIRRWVFYFSIAPWTSKHCHIHEVNNFRCGIADYAGDIWLMPDQLIYREDCAGEFLVTPVILLPYRPFRTLVSPNDHEKVILHWAFVVPKFGRFLGFYPNCCICKNKKVGVLF